VEMGPTFGTLQGHWVLSKREARARLRDEPIAAVAKFGLANRLPRWLVAGSLVSVRLQPRPG